MNAETNIPAGYRNWIEINDIGGTYNFANAELRRGDQFPVNLHPPDSNLGGASVQCGSYYTHLRPGDETIAWKGRIATFSWVLGQSNHFRFIADPYNKVKADGDPRSQSLYPVRMLLIRPNDYGFQLDDAQVVEATWDIEIFVAGDAVFTLEADGEQTYTLEQGKSSYQKLVSRLIVVGVNEIKGHVEIGYTLKQTE